MKCGLNGYPKTVTYSSFVERKSDLILISDKMKFKIPIYLGGNMLESYLKYNLPKTFDHRRSLQKNY